ncbi:hypothetical protein K4F52_001877 [Lecanicillium sp. MT-2017a]|nr:hypothetical protein K4F52_001877 [Lecanicillium sp. MT-2017a]
MTLTRPLNPPPPAGRVRLRELIPSIKLGEFPTGPKNGITDVPGVLVSTMSIHEGDGEVNTGVTTILPRRDWFSSSCYAGMFRYNGAGELTGSHWLAETGVLASPIVLSNSYAIGACHTGVYQYASAEAPDAEFFLMPVVGETFDGLLNNIKRFAVTPDHVVRGIRTATADPVQEGNTGGGTGMICQGFKGGTGTSSRVVTGLTSDGGEVTYTVAALVQANYGRMKHLHIAGAPVGRILLTEMLKDKEQAKKVAAYDAAKDKNDGSIIVVLATDAPLNPTELQRLARRATGGLSRVGGYGNNTSGDIFMAFSTAAHLPSQGIGLGDGSDGVDVRKPMAIKAETIYVPTTDPLLEAAADVTEEAIYNVLCKAETMVGWRGAEIEAMPLDKVKEIVERHLELEESFNK